MTDSGRVIESRKRVRVLHDAKVEMLFEGETVLTGRLRDISQQGLYFILNKEQAQILWPDRLYSVRLSLHSGPSSLAVEADGHVARVDRKGCAVSFTHPLFFWPVFSVFPIRKRQGEQKPETSCRSEIFSTGELWSQDLSCL